ncbi:MAG: hypothetical protein ACKVQT_37905 [Burkholderiales bacterium]
MYGWRLRLGVIAPANNAVIEPELYPRLPEGVSMLATKLLGSSGEMAAGNIQAMESTTEKAVRMLDVAEVDVMVYACMGTALVKGVAWSDALRREMTQITRARVVTAAQLTMAGLRHMSVRRVAMATPYPEMLQALVRPYFEAHGFEIVAERHLGISNVRQVGVYGPEAAYKLARSLDTSRADGVCILATDFRTLEALEWLERDIGKPVVSTNQAILWGCLRTGGVADAIAGCGQLLRETGGIPE